MKAFPDLIYRWGVGNDGIQVSQGSYRDILATKPAGKYGYGISVYFSIYVYRNYTKKTWLRKNKFYIQKKI